MRTRTIWCITLFLLCHHPPRAIGVTSKLSQAQANSPQQAPPPQRPSPTPQTGADAQGIGPLTPPEDPGFGPPPTPDTTPTPPAPAEPSPQTPPTPSPSEIAEPGIATPVETPSESSPIHIEADHQSRVGAAYTLDGNILILYNNYRVRADHALYNTADGVIIARGHLSVEGGPSDEHLLADHGDMNLKLHTAHLFAVRGTLGLQPTIHNRFVFTAPNPFTLTGRELEQLGPGRYRLLRGTLTSCRLPNPDWVLAARSILVDNDQATARNTTFRLFHTPLFYLPYATHPVKQNRRQSGILLPIVGNDTSRGFIAGESIYLVLGRSADATFGAEYFSRRGFSPFGHFRYRGRDHDFASVRFRSLLDRLSGSRNQGGLDLFVDGRKDFNPHTRAVADIEYLSHYVYRQAFEQNYSAAINSEVKSSAYLVREQNGFAAIGRFERYQNFRSDASGDEIKVLHTPALQLDALDHPLGHTGLYWGGEASAAALSRSEPGFQTSRLLPRLDIYPHLALPLSADGWHLRGQAGIRATWYGKSQLPGGAPGSIPDEVGSALTRTAFVSEVSLRPPVLERDFRSPLRFRNTELRHTIEPELTYRYTTGINQFANTLRFDTTDVLTNTNQLEYGFTQHLFIRHPRKRPCKGDQALGPDKLCGGNTVDWLSWKLAQDRYFNPTFGGALVDGQRNVFTSTLGLTGVAFLQSPRSTSPVISRLHLRTTGATSLEWDLDYDVRHGRVQSSNVFASYHAGNYAFSVGDARLFNLIPRSAGGVGGAGSSLPNAPTPTGPTPNAQTSLFKFNQIRISGVYGSPTKHGLSAGANVGYDFTLAQTQYLGAQTAYNLDCCGIAFEMRRYSLGSVRDNTQYLFSFTLAGVGSAGSLRPMARVF